MSPWTCSMEIRCEDFQLDRFFQGSYPFSFQLWSSGDDKESIGCSSMQRYELQRRAESRLWLGWNWSYLAVMSSCFRWELPLWRIAASVIWACIHFFKVSLVVRMLFHTHPPEMLISWKALNFPWSASMAICDRHSPRSVAMIFLPNSHGYGSHRSLFQDLA